MKPKKIMSALQLGEVREPIQLKAAAAQAGIGVRELAMVAGVGLAPMHGMLNGGAMPVRMSVRSRVAMQNRLVALLDKAGIAPLDALFEPLSKAAPGSFGMPLPAAVTAGKGLDATKKHEERVMLPPRQFLTMEAREFFKLTTNPFERYVQTLDEMYLNPHITYVREMLRQAARLHDFIAIIGESGSGKTTIAADFKELLLAGGDEIRLIEPSVLESTNGGRSGKQLKSASVADAIVYSLSATEQPRQSTEAKARQIRALLEASADMKVSHCILVEEAHKLSVPLLKNLKNYSEMQHSRKRSKLLGVVLIGQPELARKLSQFDPAVREVSQRIGLITLQPLGNDLTAYLTKRCEPSRTKLAALIDASGIEAMRARLMMHQPGKSAPTSLLYPLAINNLTIAALNKAAEIGVPIVNGAVVKAVQFNSNEG